MEDTPLEFPATHPLKVMGRNTPDFRTAVRDVLRRRGATPDLDERPSRDGTFVSLRFEMHIASRAELDALYRELHATGHVLFAL